MYRKVHINTQHAHYGINDTVKKKLYWTHVWGL